ncbi:MAG: TonB-dependent receptor, partial [Parvularculaceae bacterium]|nr:TonB-dependent receptor [Parvularculaceae bacterium]
MVFSKKSGLFLAASSGAILLSMPAIAQETGAETPASGSRSVLADEVVVTATRREESVQDVGISVAAFSGEQLTTLGVETAGDITQITPNVEIVRSYASPGFNTQITIRGVGQPDFQDTTEAVVTTYVDEFYMVGAGQSDFMVFDTQRAEVARGPQGTVQG